MLSGIEFEYLKIHSDAVLISTPTKLVHSDTTSSNVALNCFSGRSCWYIPTPRCFGSILTNSARGSCNLRANDTKKENFPYNYTIAV